MNSTNASSQKVNLGFTGIASFAKSPICTDLDQLNADVAVMGIPWDEAVTFRPGTRFGPRSVREFSTRYTFNERGIPQGGYYDIHTETRYLEGVTIVDCGDSDILFTNQTWTFQQATEMVRKIKSKGAMPVIIGGDHSITPCIVEAFSDEGPINIVQIDAHLDYDDEVFGVKYANGSPMKRLSEMPFVNKMFQFGMRSVRTWEDAYLDSKNRGNIIIPMAKIRKEGLEMVLQSLKGLGGKTYVTIDIDAFDPSIAPGTGSPEPDGFQHWQVAEILKEVAANTHVVGFDMVEVNPLVDHSGLTPAVAATTMVEFIGEIFYNRK
jgi:agmatinase